MRLPYYVGPDPVPALASGLAIVAGDSLGMAAAGAELHLYPGRSGRALLELPEVGELLSARAGGVVLWTGSAEAQHRLAELGVAALNSPPGVARRLENKVRFTELARAASLPLPPAVCGPAGPDLVESAARLGFPSVFQLARGYSGLATHPVPDQPALERLAAQFRGRPSRVTRRIEGLPVTVTGVVLPGRIRLGPPCVQLTGIPELTPHPLGSCGNDFATPVPMASKVEAVATAAARLLLEAGHLGVFGVDLVAGEGEAWLIEVNPRLVASVPLWSLTARDHGGVSLLDLHLAAFGVGEGAEAELECRWSQLILYRLREGGGKAAADSVQGRLTSSGTLEHLAPLSLSGPPPGEVAVLRHPGARSGRELARVIVEGPLLGADGGLRAKLRQLVSGLREELEPPERGR